jgi:NADPH:quinone reductase-like Zn-dependent oxidoreductase
MRLRYRIAASLAIFLTLGGIGLLIALGRQADCASLPALGVVPEGTAAVTAAVRRCYGPPAVIEVARLPQPALEDDRVRVRVAVASINPADWHFVRGEPYLMRFVSGLGTPSDPRIGSDFAGVVEAVGREVTRFKPGDVVFGGRNGALGEYVDVRESGSVAAAPAGVELEQLAALPIAGVTALQALRERGRVAAGERVLVNGASGGVGTFAVQLARHMGAHVTGVSSTRNLELVRSLGADRVIDYTREDFTRDAARYDLVIDNVGNRPLADIRRVLAPRGRYLLVGGGGPDAGPWVGALIGPLRTALAAPFVDQQLAFFVSETTPGNLAELAALVRDGRLRAVIDRRYPLAQVVEAMTYLESGRARGKVIIEMPARARREGPVRPIEPRGNGT